jgi:molybdopterin molybdotransferase
MLSINEALEHCLGAVLPISTELVPLEQAHGRILTEDLTAPTPLPPWDNSAMDGFAVQAADLGPAQDTDCFAAEAADGHGTILNLLETIAAGASPSHVVTQGSCSRIMTGAPMPKGADAVVMREYTEVLDDGRIRVTGGARSGQHIRTEGAEVPAGAVVLSAGQVLSAPALGLCASVGRAVVPVARQIRVGIVSTGDELVPPGQSLGPGQIHASNGYALSAWVLAAGAIPVDCGIAPDDLESTRRVFRSAINCDVVISTGGVSVGDFDVVRQAMIDEGAQMHFWRVRMKPGKPLAFGVIGGRPAFGLPGNPASCQVGFIQFVRPFLRMSMGDPRPFLPVVDATLMEDVRKRAGRAELVRVSLSWVDGRLQARAAGSQSSGQQSSMLRADGLMLLAPEQGSAPAGSPVKVQLLQGSADTPGYPW